MTKKLAGALAVIALFGCATPPATYTVNNSRAYKKPYDEVWERLVAFFATRNIQVKNIAKDSGVIYAESTRFDDSVADCGKPGIFVVVGRRANFNVFVSRAGKDPVVSVNTEFVEMRRFDYNVHTVQCNSKGVLEEMILSAMSSS